MKKWFPKWNLQGRLCNFTQYTCFYNCNTSRIIFIGAIKNHLSTVWRGGMLAVWPGPPVMLRPAAEFVHTPTLPDPAAVCHAKPCLQPECCIWHSGFIMSSDAFVSHTSQPTCEIFSILFFFFFLQCAELAHNIPHPHTLTENCPFF